MSDRIYYEVLPESPLLPIIRECQQRDQQFRTAAQEFKELLKADGMMVHEYARLTGLLYDDETKAPPGWRKNKEGYWVPNLRNKAGRTWEERRKALPKGVDAWDFGVILEGKYTYHGEGFVYFPFYQQLGDFLVFSIPSGCTHRPEGCRELLVSEYQANLEAYKKARDAAHPERTVSI